jgi:hypothetical protein
MESFGAGQSTSSTISEYAASLAGVASGIALSANDAYRDRLVIRAAVWAAGVAALAIFIQDPLTNMVASAWALFYVAIYLVLMLTAVAATAHYIHSSEQAAAVHHLQLTTPPVQPVPIPQRLTNESSLSPKEILLQRWSLPPSVVGELGKALFAPLPAISAHTAERLCRSSRGAYWT